LSKITGSCQKSPPTLYFGWILCWAIPPIIAQPKINLQSFKSTPDSLKQQQQFKAFGSLGDPDLYICLEFS